MKQSHLKSLILPALLLPAIYASAQKKAKLVKTVSATSVEVYMTAKNTDYRLTKVETVKFEDKAATAGNRGIGFC
jgi:hypothetical protein